MSQMGEASARCTWECNDGTVVELAVSNPGRELTDVESRVYRLMVDTLDDMLGSPTQEAAS